MGYLLDEKIPFYDTETTITKIYNQWINSEFFKKNSELITILEPISSTY